MSRSNIGRALCIGVDATQPAAQRAIRGAEADALALAGIANHHGFTRPVLLLGPDATRGSVQAGLRTAASLCEAGDFFLLTFSGHGGRKNTADAHGLQGLREVWVLYDGSYEDEEMHDALAAFKPGVRVLVVSDSCNGGVPAACRENPASPVSASVLVLTACQQNQFADGVGHPGHFTTALVSAWQRGLFGSGHYSHGYRSLYAEVAARMPAYQRPNYYWVGSFDAQFEAERPFTL